VVIIVEKLYDAVEIKNDSKNRIILLLLTILDQKFNVYSDNELKEIVKCCEEQIKTTVFEPCTLDGLKKAKGGCS
jgi:hypothetical protein